MDVGYDAALDAIVIRWRGSAGLGDLASLMPKIVGHTSFRAGMNQLVDATQGTIEMSGAEIRELVERLAPQLDSLGEGYSLAIATGRTVDFGQSRMYETLAAQYPVDIRVFDGLEPARAWLAERRALRDGGSEPDS